MSDGMDPMQYWSPPEEPSVRCPNCFKPAYGLYSHEVHRVSHCGCYYEADPSEVLFHSDTDDHSKCGVPIISEHELYNIGLLEMCQRVHMFITGSMPDEKLELVQEYVRYLAKRLGTWNEAPTQTKSYDDAVRNFIQATLEEYRANRPSKDTSLDGR